MIKNRTRKGLALAAAGSLALTGLVGVPAQATGLLVDGYVSLAPTTGTEYDVLTGNAKEFSLTATFSNAAEDSGEYLKFLVTNTNEDIVAVDASSTQYVVTSAEGGADNVVLTNVGAVDRVTITTGATNFNVGDAITVAGFDGAESDHSTATTDMTSVNGAATVEAVTATTVSYLLGNLGTEGAFGSDNDIVIKLNTPSYTASTDSFVYNTKSDSNNTDKALVLKTGSITTKRVATVTAWIDSNDNDTIQAGEYVSPTRTVTWNTAADVTVATALTYPTAADASLAASVTLTPNLNGNQLAADDITVGFTRPGSTATVYANATQASVSRAWSVTQSLGTGNWAGLSHIGQISKVTDNNSVTGNTMKVFTDGSYGVGDTVTVSGTTSQNNDVVAAAAGTTNSAAGAVVLADAAFDVGGKAEAAVDPETGFVQVVTRKLKDVSATVSAATYETLAVHGLNIGDIITIDAAATANNAQFDITRAVVASIPSTTEFTVAGTFVVVSANTTDTGTVTVVSGIEAVPGTYSAKTKVATVARGNTSTNVSISNTSDDTTLATTATVDVQGVSNSDATTTTTAYVRALTTTAELTATVVDASDVAVTAGRSVKVSLENTQGNNTTKTGTFSVNGVLYTSAVYLTTNASGQVTFTVSDNDGAAGTEVRVLVTAENLTGAKTADVELLWSAAVYTVLDMNDNAAAAATGENSISVNGSYAYDLSVLDQWKTAPANGTHRVKYVTAGNNVATNYLTLVAGKAGLSVTDNQIGAGTSITTTLSLDKLGTDGITWTSQDLLNDGNSDGVADTVVYTTSILTQTDAVLLDSDGSTAYGAGTADLSNTATTTQLVPQDRRSANLVQPAYGTNVLVTGRVAHATTNVPRAGASVTISGPANILFSDGAVDALGSLTIKTDSAGEFGVKLFSITVATNAVITVTSGGVSKTTKVSFTGQGASFGTSWTVTAPTSVLAGSTFQYKAKLTDKYGNGVTVAAPDIKVTYVGPGLIVGNLPTVTDASGELSFSVLMGSNDSGTATVTVSYDQGSDDDFTGTAAGDLDVVTSNLITVGAVASSATKVNAGSFKGYVALYAKGYKGQRMSAKVGKDWVVVASLASNFERVVEFTGAGVDVAVRIYIDRVLLDTINLTTK